MAGKNFLKELSAELDRLSVPGSDRGKERPVRQGQSSIPGAPGSPERFAFAASQIPDPQLRAELVSEVGWNQVGVFLDNALHKIRAFEEVRDYEDGEPYPPDVAEAFASAARMLGRVGDERLVEAFYGELEAAGSELADYLPSAVQHMAEEGHLESWELARAAEEQRMAEREKVLNAEYGDIHRRTGEAGLAAADQLANSLAEEGTLYHPAADELQLRGQLRSAAEAAAATRRGIRKGAFLAGLDNEFVRMAAPGSRWGDKDREEWERQLREGTVEIAEREFSTADDLASRTVDGLISDDLRRKTGKGALERALDAEFAEMDEHNQRAPHKKAMAKELVDEYRQTHHADGRPLHSDVGGRYD